VSTTTIFGGTIVDGTGAPRRTADLVIDGERIGQIGVDLPRSGCVIDATGKVVCPGFIDMHSHSGILALVEPELLPKVSQGITTEVPGVDGLGAAPIRREHHAQWRAHISGLDGNPPVEWRWQTFGEYLGQLPRTGPNLAPLTGHGNLRLSVMGMENRPAGADEIRLMCDLFRRSIEEGATGLSTGLVYAPHAYATYDELLALARVVGETDTVFAVHMRFEGARVLESLREWVRIGRESGASIHISHFKAMGKMNWGLGKALRDEVGAARANGVDITVDQYPYTAGSTMLGACLPPWAHALGIEGLRRALKDAAVLALMEPEIAQGLPNWESYAQHAGWENVVVSSVESTGNEWSVGKSLADIAREWRCTPFQALIRLLLEEDFAVGMIIHMMDPRDVDTLLTMEGGHMIGTDGLLGGKPHPRVYGTYPRLLGRYVRERGLLPLEALIHKATGLPASRLRITDRGVLREGAYADVVVFDPTTVADRATFEDPRQFPVGIEHVFVNGQAVISEGRPTQATPGRVLS
jgi:N-acyl-D-amino-acid deacylase